MARGGDETLLQFVSWENTNNLRVPFQRVRRVNIVDKIEFFVITAINPGFVGQRNDFI